MRAVPVWALACVAGLAILAHAAAQPAQYPFRDPSLPVDRRVDDLVRRLTLEEKAQQMGHAAPAIPRLGIPAYDYWSEGLHGIARSGYATVFPQAIGLAATWDPELVHRAAGVIADEARARYEDAIRHNIHSIYFGLTVWSPNINIFRDPRWGRGQETYGEDPFLAAQMGKAFVRGLQGEDPRYDEVIATPKHYAVHSGPESERHRFNVNPSPYDLESTYLPAFRAAVVEGRAGSIMCAYNAVDGVPACANPMLLGQTLRQAWGFQGFVTSDCGAISDFFSPDGHRFSPDAAHASARAVLAGTDTSCGDEYSALPDAVREGLLPESALDTALKRLFTARMRLGMFDPPGQVPYAALPAAVIDSPAHRRMALLAAREAMVLLRNENATLPLRGVRRLAVVGPNAASLVALEGNYNGQPSHPVLPVDGIAQAFPGAKILYAEGSPYVEGAAIPVPRTALHVRGEYFDNTRFAGRPVLTRSDPQIEFDWAASPPAPGVPASGFSVRWSGTLTAPAPGDYKFQAELASCYPCNDRETVKVFVEGRPVAARDTGAPAETRPPAAAAFTLHLADRRPHGIRIEYTHSAPLFGAGITLLWQPPPDALQAEAVAAARQADAVVAVVGLSPRLEGEEMPVHVPGFSGGDRTSIELPAVQERLLAALAATHRPLIVVLMNGSALAVRWAAGHAAAILEAWYPGGQGGTAIGETLAGANNPAGRLPVTFYASTAQLPPFEDYSMRNRTYRYLRERPLYGFGYGLSYTHFRYTGLKLSAETVAAGQPLAAAVTLHNDGPVAGDEVAELYLKPALGQGRPELRGVSRVHLAAGESRSVRFTLSPRDMSTVDEAGRRSVAAGRRSVAAGRYSVMIGGAQPDEAPHAEAQFAVSGSLALPR